MCTPSTSIRADLSLDPIYLHHPSVRHNLQSPLALQPASTARSPVLVDNHYITGVHTSKSPNDNSYDIYLYLPNDNDTDTLLYTLVINQLKTMESAGYIQSPRPT